MKAYTGTTERSGKRRDGLGERKAYLADAGGEPARGSDKADCRPCYAIGLFDLGMKEMALTGTEQGEKVSNFKSFGTKGCIMNMRGDTNRYGLCVAENERSGGKRS
ncbi:MAG: hypothetical protein LBG43_01060 [Treponema sp.]|nr:hypothetical protein [Treponema sp.]